MGNEIRKALHPGILNFFEVPPVIHPIFHVLYDR